MGSVGEFALNAAGGELFLQVADGHDAGYFCANWRMWFAL